MKPGSGIYVGTVAHQRLRPLRHYLSYRVFSLLLDLDEINLMGDRLRLFSHNSFNLVSFHDRDHGPRDGSPLRPWVERHLHRAGLEAAGHHISLLSFPRLLGYAFNPLSIYFCHEEEGRMGAILYEVKNTFGEQHGYLFRVSQDQSDVLRHDCAKQFYVSPFMKMAGRYAFRLQTDFERFSLTIRQEIDGEEQLRAVHSARRRQISDRSLLTAFLAHPLLGLKVIGGIHWEALKLWKKRASYHRRPAPPLNEVSYE